MSKDLPTIVINSEHVKGEEQDVANVFTLGRVVGGSATSTLPRGHPGLDFLQQGTVNLVDWVKMGEEEAKEVFR